MTVPLRSCILLISRGRRNRTKLWTNSWTPSRTARRKEQVSTGSASAVMCLLVLHLCAFALASRFFFSADSFRARPLAHSLPQCHFVVPPMPLPLLTPCAPTFPRAPPFLPARFRPQRHPVVVAPPAVRVNHVTGQDVPVRCVLVVPSLHWRVSPARKESDGARHATDGIACVCDAYSVSGR